jgi:hypothetical protein
VWGAARQLPLPSHAWATGPSVRKPRHDSPAAHHGQRTERLHARRGRHGWCYHGVMPSPEHMQRTADGRLQTITTTACCIVTIIVILVPGHPPTVRSGRAGNGRGRCQVYLGTHAAGYVGEKLFSSLFAPASLDRSEMHRLHAAACTAGRRTYIIVAPQ